MSSGWRRSAEEMFLALQRAVPEAFLAGIETELRDFLVRLLGDRATARREALRRAQVAADLRTGSGSHAAINPGSSQSASSLQALSIDNPRPEVEAEQRISSPPTLPAPAARRRAPLALALGVALVALLALGGVLRGIVPSGLSTHTATSSAPMVELPVPARAPAAHSVSPTPAPPDVGPASGSAHATNDEPVPAPSMAPATPAPQTSASVKRALTAPAGKSRPRPRNRDLIAPDYAR